MTEQPALTIGAIPPMHFAVEHCNEGFSDLIFADGDNHMLLRVHPDSTEWIDGSPDAAIDMLVKLARAQRMLHDASKRANQPNNP